MAEYVGSNIINIHETLLPELTLRIIMFCNFSSVINLIRVDKKFKTIIFTPINIVNYLRRHQECLHFFMIFLAKNGEWSLFKFICSSRLPISKNIEMIVEGRTIRKSYNIAVKHDKMETASKILIACNSCTHQWYTYPRDVYLKFCSIVKKGDFDEITREYQKFKDMKVDTEDQRSALLSKVLSHCANLKTIKHLWNLAVPGAKFCQRNPIFSHMIYELYTKGRSVILIELKQEKYIQQVYVNNFLMSKHWKRSSMPGLPMPEKYTFDDHIRLHIPIRDLEVLRYYIKKYDVNDTHPLFLLSYKTFTAPEFAYIFHTHYKCYNFKYLESQDNLALLSWFLNDLVSSDYDDLLEKVEDFRIAFHTAENKVKFATLKNFFIDINSNGELYYLIKTDFTPKDLVHLEYNYYLSPSAKLTEQEIQELKTSNLSW